MKHFHDLPWRRIAATTACLIACGLVIALWWRSYDWMDYGVHADSR